MMSVWAAVRVCFLLSIRVSVGILDWIGLHIGDM